MHASASSVGLARPKPSISNSIKVVTKFLVWFFLYFIGVNVHLIYGFKCHRHLPGTSILANKLSFLSLRATLNTNLQAPVKFDPVTSNCEYITNICIYGGCVCML